MIDAVFLDLDGTLMDSKPGIVSSLKAAFHAIDRPELADGDLNWMIGPPFIDSFRKIGLDDPDAAIEAYRAHYQSSGMFDADVYATVPEVLETLTGQGFRLYLATAKPHAYARMITAHFGLSRFMVEEFGPELDGTRNWKGDLLRHALDKTGETAGRSVMIGDRHHDIAAAQDVGMASIAVRWGYGTESEWVGADTLIDRPGDLPGAISALAG